MLTGRKHKGQLISEAPRKSLREGEGEEEGAMDRGPGEAGRYVHEKPSREVETNK